MYDCSFSRANIRDELLYGGAREIKELGYEHQELLNAESINTRSIPCEKMNCSHFDDKDSPMLGLEANDVIKINAIAAHYNKSPQKAAEEIGKLLGKPKEDLYKLALCCVEQKGVGIFHAQTQQNGTLTNFAFQPEKDREPTSYFDFSQTFSKNFIPTLGNTLPQDFPNIKETHSPQAGNKCFALHYPVQKSTTVGEVQDSEHVLRYRLCLKLETSGWKFVSHDQCPVGAKQCAF